MKALLVTSWVTFIPRNYDDFVCGLATCPEVGGLLVLDNRGLALVGKGFALVALGAPRIGWTLLGNLVGRSPVRRRAAFAKHSKPVWVLRTINCSEAVALIRDHGFDLVVNARTRYIYKKPILEAPPLGCINVHHGLLPDQRGTMCDLWALYDNVPAGFSVHRMAPRVDAGEVIARVEVSDGSDRDYRAYLARSAQRERQEVEALLRRIGARGDIDSRPNVPGPDLVYRKNPTWREMRAMRRRGLRL
jgi:methionyl-tRNA formyltransferase